SRNFPTGPQVYSRGKSRGQRDWRDGAERVVERGVQSGDQSWETTSGTMVVASGSSGGGLEFESTERRDRGGQCGDSKQCGGCQSAEFGAALYAQSERL